LCFDQILDGACAKVRHAPAVALHGYFILQAGQGRGSIQLRQGPVHKPPNNRASDTHENSDDPKQTPENKNSSQANPFFEVKL
jgi:hypothetical protein